MMRNVVAFVAMLWLPLASAHGIDPAELREAHERAARLSAKGDTSSAARVLLDLKARCEKAKEGACAREADAHLHRLGPAATAELPKVDEERAHRAAEESRLTGNGARSIDLLRGAREDCRRRHDVACEGRVGLGLADSLRAAGKNGEALEELRRAAGMLDKDLPVKAKALSSLGELLLEAGDHRNALPVYQQALEVFRRVEDPRGAATALRGIGAAYVRLDDRGKALEAFTKARNLSRQVGDRQGAEQAEVMMRSLGQHLQPPPPPPPPPPDGGGTETVKVARYPNVLAQSRVEVGQEFPVAVSLSNEREATDVEISEAEKTPDGKMVMRLPKTAKEWLIRVALMAPDFDITSNAVATITVPKDGPSKRAMFTVRARTEGKFTIWVMFSASTGYMGKAVKRIEVLAAGALAAAGGAAPPVPEASQQPVATASGTAVNDLEVKLRWAMNPVMVGDDPELYYPVGVFIEWPRFERNPLSKPELVPADLKDWLEPKYQRILARAGRGFAVPGDPAPSKDNTIAAARALGVELWKRYVPASVQKAIVDADALARKNHPGEPLRIQIISNNPLLPWELVRFVDDSEIVHDFLGIEAALARGHETDQQSVSTDPVLALRAMRPVFPTYHPPWPALDVQGETPASLMTDAIGGTRAAIRRALDGTTPVGLLHFAGHGTLVQRGANDTDFALVLEDGPLTAAEWPGLAAKRPGPFFAFVNACEQGKLERAGGRVEGWAPAMIESGAVGFVGALWPITNDGAKAFAQGFYEAALASENRPTVPEALARVRRRFLDNGDPTYLAYVYYGYSSLRLDVPSAKP